MRVLLLILVVANLMFFSIHQGYLGPILPDSREPARMKGQIEPDRLHIVALPAAVTAPPGPAPAASPGPATPP